MKKSPTYSGWKDVPAAGVIIHPGNAIEYDTGSWRSFRPVWDEEKCSQCLICWILCPDCSIIVEDKKMTGIDYGHCKGCGICAQECPKSAIKMEEESMSR